MQAICKFNIIPREGNPEIPINSYKQHCREHMIRNGMWDLFSLPDPLNKEKKWYILLHWSIFTLGYVKRHVQSLQKGSEADRYVVHNLTWSGVYLRSTFSNTLHQKVLEFLSLTATIPEVSVSTMNTFLYDYYGGLEDTLTRMKSLKLKSFPGQNVADFCAAILVEDERLDSAGALNHEHLGYITCIFEDTYDSRFRLWDIHDYNNVTEFINKLCVCDMDVIL